MTESRDKVRADTGGGGEKVGEVKGGAEAKSKGASEVEPKVEDTKLEGVSLDQMVDAPREPDGWEYGAKVPTGEKDDEGKWKGKRVGFRKKDNDTEEP